MNELNKDEIRHADAGMVFPRTSSISNDSDFDIKIPEYEQRLDDVFLETFDTNHPAMLDWANIKFELKRLRAKENIALASYVKGLNERK